MVIFCMYTGVFFFFYRNSITRKRKLGYILHVYRFVSNNERDRQTDRQTERASWAVYCMHAGLSVITSACEKQGVMFGKAPRSPPLRL